MDVIAFDINKTGIYFEGKSAQPHFQAIVFFNI